MGMLSLPGNPWLQAAMQAFGQKPQAAPAPKPAAWQQRQPLNTATGGPMARRPQGMPPGFPMPTGAPASLKPKMGTSPIVNPVRPRLPTGQ